MSFSFTDRLTELNNARERSLITDEEYAMLRGRLFDSFVMGPQTSTSPISQQYFSPPLSPQLLSSSPQQFSLPPPKQFSLPSHQQFSLPPQQPPLPSHQNSAPVNIIHDQNSNSHSAQASSSTSSVSIFHSKKSTLDDQQTEESTSTSLLPPTSILSQPRQTKSSNNSPSVNLFPSDRSLSHSPGSGSGIITSLFNAVSSKKSTLPVKINDKKKNVHFTNDDTATTSDNVGMHSTSNDVHTVNVRLQPEVEENRYSSSAPSRSIPIATTGSLNVTFKDSPNITQPPPRRSLTKTRPSSMIYTNSERAAYEISRSNVDADENDDNESQQQQSLPLPQPRQPHVNAAVLLKRHARALSLGLSSSISSSSSDNPTNQSDSTHCGNNNNDTTVSNRNESNDSANNASNESIGANSRTTPGNLGNNNDVLTETDQFEQLVPEVPPPPYTPPESSQIRGRRRPSNFFIKPKTSAELRKELQKLIEQSKKEANSLKIEEARLRMRLNSKPEDLERVKRKTRESSEKYRKKIEAVNNKLRQTNAREQNVDGSGRNEISGNEN